VYTGEQLIYDQQYGEEFDRLRTLVGRLRRKLVALAPDQPELFAVYRRLGYRLGIPTDT
jgi:DNA-binding response OmpR family regulator